MADAGDVGAGNDYTSFDSIILPAKGKAHQYAILGQAMRKAGAVWNNYSIVIRRAPIYLGAFFIFHHFSHMKNGN